MKSLDPEARKWPCYEMPVFEDVACNPQMLPCFKVNILFEVHYKPEYLGYVGVHEERKAHLK